MIELDHDYLCSLAIAAGEAILQVYRTDFSVERKDDRSPLTLADRRSHEIISRGLLARYPQIPVLSEEGREISHAERSRWTHFWLVDPLDGTKEFVKRNGEFTVNIALMEGTTPVFGLIFIPVPGLLYLGDTHTGSWEISGGRRREVRVTVPREGEPVKVVKSRSHPSARLEAVLGLLPSHELITRGSALKFCTVASGAAHFYPRFGPTMEWDTAAGHAIVAAAGGMMVDFMGNPFRYNKPELLNGPFLVASSADWLKHSGILDRVASLGPDGAS